MAKKIEKKKVRTTWDGKSLVEEMHAISLPVTYSNKMTLMLHQEIGKGVSDGKEFRLIMDVMGRGFRLEYNHRQIDFNTMDLANSMMKKMVELNKIKR